MDPKQLREQLGLPADATDEVVNARLALIKQLSDAGVQPTKVEPPKPPEPTKVQLQLSEEIKKLKEENPAAAALISHLEDQIQVNGELSKQLREESVVRKLHEFDASKITLTPVARELVKEIMLHEGMNVQLAEKIWTLLDHMKTGSNFYVELGERAGMTIKYGERGDKNADQRIKQLTETLVQGGMKYGEAIEKVARENPQLYEEYRRDSYAFQA